MNQDLANKGWGAMETLLDEHLPTARRRRPVPFLWLWLGIAILLVVVSLFYINSTDDGAEQPTKKPAASLNHHQSAVTQEPTAAVKMSESSIANVAPKTKEASGNAETTSANNSRNHNNKVTSQQNTQRKRSSENSGVNSSVDEGKVISSEQKLNASHVSAPSLISESRHMNTSRDAQAANQGNPTSAQHTSPKSNLVDLPDAMNAISSLEEESAISSLDGLPALPLHQMEISPTKVELESVILASSANVGEATYHRWAVSAGVLKAEDMVGGQLALGRYTSLSNRLGLYTGLAFNQMTWDKKTSSRAVSQADLVSSKAYTQYLADENIKAADFIRATSTIYVPIHIQYSIDRFLITAGIKPGIQINQRLSYTPLTAAASDPERNPNVGSNLSASDFFNTRTIGVISTTVGIGYTFGSRWTLFANYDMSLSDVSRGVQYAGPDKLERIDAGEIARPYYEIRQDAIRPKTYELKLQYRF